MFSWARANYLHGRLVRRMRELLRSMDSDAESVRDSVLRDWPHQVSTMSAREARGYLDHGLIGNSRYVPEFVSSDVVRSVSGGTRLSRGSTQVALVDAGDVCRVTTVDVDMVAFVMAMAVPCISSALGSELASLTIVLCLTDGQPKRAPADEAGSAWRADHVNSGLSVVSANGRIATVLVYRREEYVKVLLHELLHSHGLDRHLHSPDAGCRAQLAHIDAAICEAFSIRTLPTRGQLRLGEALVDAHAMAMHVLLSAALRTISSSTAPRGRKYAGEVEACYAATLAASDRACAIVLSRLQHATATAARPFVEATHVFAYYVVKCALLHSLHLLPGERASRDALSFVEAAAKALMAPAFTRSVLSKDDTLSFRGVDTSMRMSAPLLADTEWSASMS